MVSINRDSKEQKFVRVSQALSRGKMFPTSGLKDIVTVEIDASVFHRWITVAINIIQQALLDQMLCSPSNRNIIDVACGERP